MLIGAVPDVPDLPDLGEEERPGHVVRALRGHLAAGCVEERARERERERDPDLPWNVALFSRVFAGKLFHSLADQS